MPPARGRYSAEFQLTADTGGLKRGFADARRQQQQFLGVSRDAWRQFGRLATVGTAAATAALAGFGAAGLSAARDIQTLQRQTNLSAEAASNWRLALRAVGGDITDVEDLLRTLNSRVIEFSKGESTASDAFRALGATVSDFDLSDPNQQLQTFLALLERAPHSQAQFAADELIGDTSRFALQLAAARKQTDLLQQSFGRQIADTGEIAAQWGLIKDFATASAESIGVSFLRGLTAGVGSSEDLAGVLREDVLPVVRQIESAIESIGTFVGTIVSGVDTLRRGFGDLAQGGDIELNGETFRFDGGNFVPVGPSGDAPEPEIFRPRDASGNPRELVVTPRTIRTTPLHRRTQAISDRAIEGERIAADRRRFLLRSIAPGPQDDPRSRLAQATPDFQARFAQQQELAQQAWWRDFWDSSGRSLQQGLTSSIGGAIEGFVSGPEAGSLKALGQNLLQGLSSTIARAFAQALVKATIGKAIGSAFSAGLGGLGGGAGGGTVPITGFYNAGGIVPGPVGRPQGAIVHGGEAVFTPDQLSALRGGGDTYVFNLADVSRQSEEAVNSMLDRIIAAVGRDRYERGLAA